MYNCGYFYFNCVFNFLKNKAEDFFAPHEKQTIVNAVKQAEKQTSGEIRIFIESKCAYVKAIDRAIEVFDKLDMQNTFNRNAVLVYVAIKHRQLAIYADAGINNKVAESFWQQQLQLMQQHFGKEDFVEGIVAVVHQIGEALQTHFPYQNSDVNELSDEIVFGK